jgi:HupE / UreJ protein
MKRLAMAAVAAAQLAAAHAALAHPAPFSYVDVHIDEDAIQATIVAHVFDLAHELALEPPERLLQPDEAAHAADALSRLLSPRLVLIVDGTPVHARWSAPTILADRQSLQFSATYPAARPGTIGVHALLFPYDPTHQTFLNVYEHGALTSQAILDARRQDVDYFAGTAQGRTAVVRRFLPAGFRDVLGTPEHLFFLIGLLLVGGSLRRLVLIVSAFTLAHTAALALAASNVVAPAPRLIEPAIALSIVYVGVDNLMVRGGRDVRPWIGLAFGLIYGFGAASLLRDADLSSAALRWSLASFNLGVGVGALVVVGGVAAALAAVHSRNDALGRRLVFAGSVVVAAAGSFWFVERLLS